MKYRLSYPFRLVLLLSLLSLSDRKTSYAQEPAAPLALARQVADRFIADTRFDLVFEPQEEVLGMQVVDFTHLGLRAGQEGYSICSSLAAADTLVRFGVSSEAKMKVWLNGVLVFEQEAGAYTSPKEIAYGKFRFGRYFSALLRKGANNWLIMVEAGANRVPAVLLRPQTSADDLNAAVAFSPKGELPGAGWLYAGPFPLAGHTPSPAALQAGQLNGTTAYYWQKAPQRLLPVLKIDSSAVYQRESYANWHYAHGLSVWSIFQLAGATRDNRYEKFVKRYTDFVLDNSAYFRYQYEHLYGYRGTLHRLFRRTMLDDTGAPILPFAALYTTSDKTALKALTDTILQVVRKEQVRLPDGTFCRPEPEAFTVWADDLFMSVPFLSIMATATGDATCYDEAASQVLQFQQYLLDRPTGLYKHGWFSASGQQAIAYWGRANGWIVWATAELLQVLPRQHKDRTKVLAAFRQHVAALIKCQQPDGMWRQLLNRTDAYAETSCTAMFTLAIARGVRMGWLPNSYKKFAALGWQGVARQIGAGGIVHGICRGTEIGFDEAFYLNRKQLDNDPRGLGAVITAAIEIAKLEGEPKTPKLP